MRSKINKVRVKMLDIFRVTAFFVAAVCSVAGVVAAVDPLVGDKATVSSEETNPGFGRSLNLPNGLARQTSMMRVAVTNPYYSAYKVP
jgi:putative intracellular protease/amidase